MDFTVSLHKGKLIDIDFELVNSNYIIRLLSMVDVMDGSQENGLIW